MDYQQKIKDAIVAAHEAGDTEGAQILANELKSKISNMPSVSNLPKLTTKDRILQGIRDPIDAAAQGITHMLPDAIVNPINKFNNFIADKTGLVGKLPAGGIDQQITDRENQYQSQRAAQGESGFDAARLAGNIVSPANLAIASKLPVGATIGQKIFAGVSGGAGLNAITQPVVNATPENYPIEKTKQAAIGGLSGGLFNGLTSSLGRVISPKASLNPNVALLKNEGVTPTIGQTLGGSVGKAEEKLQSLPILGDMITRARGQANNQFEAASHNRALAPIGLKLPDGLSGREAINYTENALKENYDRVLNNIGAIKPDQQFNNSLASLQDKAKKLLLPKDRMNDFNRALNEIKNSIDSNGYITSDAYKTLESSLGRDAQILSSSQDVSSNKIAPAIKQMQKELKDMLQRQSGQYSDELQATNKGWANFKRVQKASSSLGAEDGMFSPAQYQSAIKALDKSKDKGSFARGNALGQDLGDAGKSVLTGKVADSGTAGRTMLGLGALASGSLSPAIPASLLGGGLLYTQPAQRILNGLVSTRPDFAAPSAEFLRNNSKYLLPAFGTIGSGLLNQ